MKKLKSVKKSKKVEPKKVDQNSCPHDDHEASVVVRCAAPSDDLPPSYWMALVTVRCRKCHINFEFKGLPEMQGNFDFPTLNENHLVLQAPMDPVGFKREEPQKSVEVVEP